MLTLLSIRGLEDGTYEVVVQRAPAPPAAYVFRIELEGGVPLIKVPEDFAELIDKNVDAYGSVAQAVGAFSRGQKSLKRLGHPVEES